MQTIFKLLAIIFYGWLVLSVVVWVFWIFYPRKRDNIPEKVDNFIVVGAVLGVIGFCITGFYEILYFIPPSLGFDTEDESFKPLRSSLASFFGFCAGAYIIWIIVDRKKLIQKNKELGDRLKKGDKEE